MSSEKKKYNIFGTVTFRLTLQYTILFTVLSILVFVLFYITLTTHLRERMDEDLSQKLIEIEEISRKYSGEALRREIIRETASRGTKTIFIIIYSADHEVLAVSDLTEWRGLELDKMAVDNLFGDGEFFDTIVIPGHRYKIRIISKRIQDGKIIRIGHTLKDDEKLIKNYKKTAGIFTVLMVLSGSLLGGFVATRAMAGVKRVARSAIRIGQGDLTHRVSLKNEGEEIGNLAITFNEMAEKIQLLVKELIESTDNIAHDLRSP
ncbi:MAG: HAMP domain-containing protein, partial [Desulfobacterales bacterium]